MTHHDPLSLLDRLADAAHESEPVPLPSAEIDRMVTHALLVANARNKKNDRLRMWVPLSVAAALLLAFVLWPRATRNETRVAQSTASSSMSFATGDRWMTSTGTSIDVESMSSEARLLRMQDGNALFDVAHLEEGQTFAVVTPHLRVVVRGTVFAVSVEGAHTLVRVFEGRVDVTKGTETRALAAGASLDSNTLSAANAWTTPFFSEGERAALARSVNARVARQPGLPPTDHTTVSGHEAEERPLAHANQAPPTILSVREAESMVAEGRYDEALRAATRIARNDPERASWYLVEGDASRALHRYDEAVAAYLHAAETMSPSRATLAGYLAARVRFENMHDASGALRALDTTHADVSGSPVEERALELRVRVLLARGDRENAQRAARAYTVRFPGGASTEFMNSVLGASVPVAN